MKNIGHDSLQDEFARHTACPDQATLERLSARFARSVKQSPDTPPVITLRELAMAVAGNRLRFEEKLKRNETPSF